MYDFFFQSSLYHGIQPSTSIWFGSKHTCTWLLSPDHKENPFLDSKKKLEEANWVTKGPERALKQCLPISIDTSDDGNNTHKTQSLVDAATCLFMLGYIFVPGPMYVSLKQLAQLCHCFSHSWAFQVTHWHKRMSCHFAESGYKNKITIRTRTGNSQET